MTTSKNNQEKYIFILNDEQKIKISEENIFKALDKLNKKLVAKHLLLQEIKYIFIKKPGKMVDISSILTA